MHDYSTIAEFYDHVVPYRNRADVPFFVGAAKESGGPVLEIGCGTGRILIPVARAGCEITGLDLSEPMLAICREKLFREPADVQARAKIVAGDMRKFELGQSFRLVIAPFRCFLHLLEVKDQLDCLAAVHRHLSPGGRFILDVFDPSLETLTDKKYRQEYGDEPEFTMPDGRRVQRRSRNAAYDSAHQIVDSELIYNITYPDGRAERLVDSFPVRCIFRYEAEHLLARSGFELEAVYGGYDKSPFGAKVPGELICVARKP